MSKAPRQKKMNSQIAIEQAFYVEPNVVILHGSMLGPSLVVGQRGFTVLGGNRVDLEVLGVGWIGDPVGMKVVNAGVVVRTSEERMEWSGISVEFEPCNRGDSKS